MEIVCDESGSEGEKLIGATTDVFAHASVRFDVESATLCLREVRARAPTLAIEYKANHILREKNSSALTWLLGHYGPLHGNAHVYLVDKAFFVIRKLLAYDVTGTVATALYRRGRDDFDREQWEAFLLSANNLLRANGRRDKSDLDPLIPAIVAAVVRWSDNGEPVSVIHDQQNVLSDERIEQIKEMVGESHLLADLRLVDSRSDPRVQIADVLAGVARKIASDELNGRGDAELTGLLRPFVDPTSIWADHPF